MRSITTLLVFAACSSDYQLDISATLDSCENQRHLAFEALPPTGDCAYSIAADANLQIDSHNQPYDAYEDDINALLTTWHMLLVADQDYYGDSLVEFDEVEVSPEYDPGATHKAAIYYSGRRVVFRSPRYSSPEQLSVATVHEAAHAKAPWRSRHIKCPEGHPSAGEYVCDDGTPEDAYLAAQRFLLIEQNMTPDESPYDSTMMDLIYESVTGRLVVTD